MDFFRTAAAVIVVVSHARDVVMADYNGNLLYAPFTRPLALAIRAW